MKWCSSASTGTELHEWNRRHSVFISEEPIKLLQINSVYNSGSTGRIVEGISAAARGKGFQTWAAYGRNARPGPTETYRISGPVDHVTHGLYSLALDAHGLGSRRATQRFIRWIDSLQPDIVGLHNLHGYYVHVPELFAYLRERRIPVFWTLHDCWPMTGHCSYFERFSCEKWQTGCHRCPMTSYYPQSLIDRSKQNWLRKRSLFSGLPSMTLVTPSRWLGEIVKQSYLKEYPVEVIPNGIDLESFAPLADRAEQPTILGVANHWNARKGLHDFLELRKRLPESYRIVLVGLDKRLLSKLPAGIEGFRCTATVSDLAAHYSSAWVFVNPTYSDNFPTTNLESLACGTPVVTYKTGGSPEAITKGVGLAVPQGSVDELESAVMTFIESAGEQTRDQCRRHASETFDQRVRFNDYAKLFERMLERARHR